MTNFIDGIPVYSASVDGEDTGMLRISLVDRPAVDSDFLAFAEQKAVQTYSVQDEDKRLVRGVVMRADYPIFRTTPETGDYYVVYSAETIRKMAERYLVEGRQNNVDLMHDGNDVRGIHMVQWFIKDSAAGINPEGFEGIADGSLFAEFHVERDDVWEAVKAGVFKGFSLEGIFALIIPEQFSKPTNNTNQQIMSKMKRIKEAIRRALVAFAEVTTDKGILGWDGEEDLKAGDAVYIVNEDGSRGEAADGDYLTEDNKTIVVEGGRVAEIRDPEAEVADTPEEFGEVATDGGILYHEGDEDLKEGDEVFFVDAEGNRTPAADGQYKTEDGKVITVVEGKVASIEDPEAEVAPAEETIDAEKEALRKEVESLRAQVAELRRKPAAKPAHEEVKDHDTFRKTGIRGLDRLAEKLRK